jgi:Zn ribbon nucleic-acid-binding protein
VCPACRRRPIADLLVFLEADIAEREQARIGREKEEADRQRREEANRQAQYEYIRDRTAAEADARDRH